MKLRDQRRRDETLGITRAAEVLGDLEELDRFIVGGIRTPNGLLPVRPLGAPSTPRTFVFGVAFAVPFLEVAPPGG